MFQNKLFQFSGGSSYFRGLAFFVFIVLINGVIGCKSETEYTVELGQVFGDSSSDGDVEISIRILDLEGVGAIGRSNLNSVSRLAYEKEYIQQVESSLYELKEPDVSLEKLNELLIECKIRKDLYGKLIIDSVGACISNISPVVATVSPGRRALIRAKNDSFLVGFTVAANGVKYDKIVLTHLQGGNKSVIRLDGPETIDAVGFIRRINALSKTDFSVAPEVVSWGNRTIQDARVGKSEQLLELRSRRWKDFINTINTRNLKSGARFEAPVGEKFIPMRWIPSGHFSMGSPLSELGRFSDERQHRVSIKKGFLLAETECTQEQWMLLMTNNPSYFKGQNRPVEQVTWDDAMMFCEKLNQYQLSKKLIPKSCLWRLPTEAEWEYACRSGVQEAYSGDIMLAGWVHENSKMMTHPSGIKDPNLWGLYDMHGNVWEWCFDWYNEYDVGLHDDPVSKKVSMGKTFRGGGWFLEARYSRSAARRWSAQNLRYSYVGFRPVLIIDK